MNIPSETPPTPPETPGRKPAPKILWLLVAFIPSVAALFTTQYINQHGYLVAVLLILGVVCSIVAAMELVRGMKSLAERVAVGIFLAGFFFVANVVIAVFIGCSRSGPM